MSAADIEEKIKVLEHNLVHIQSALRGIMLTSKQLVEDIDIALQRLRDIKGEAIYLAVRVEPEEPFEWFLASLLSYIQSKGYEVFGKYNMSLGVRRLIPKSVRSTDARYIVFKKRDKYYFLPMERIKTWYRRYRTPYIDWTIIATVLAAIYIQEDALERLRKYLKEDFKQFNLELAFEKFRSELGRGVVAKERATKLAPYLIFDFIYAQWFKY